MQRLCTESSCSYSGRSVWDGDANVTLKARRVCWLNKTQALQGAVTLRRANDTAHVNASVSALQSNLRRHRTEVSRGRISRECRKAPAVKGRT
jgi:hypothetical protein